MGKRYIYLYCKRICFSEPVRGMRLDLDDVQYLSSKAGKEKLCCLDAVTNLANFDVLLTVHHSKSCLYYQLNAHVFYSVIHVLQNKTYVH
jgi:hypothetical protein